MAEETRGLWDDLHREDDLDLQESYSTRFTMNSVSSRRKSSSIPGATEQCAIFSTSKIVLYDTITAFISYSKTCDIPIIPVTKPDIRTVLGQGASFLVNGCVFPADYVDPSTGNVIPEGTVVAMKRARFRNWMKRAIADRISVIYNELLTMMHPPLRAHPNIVDLIGVGFETEGPMSEQKAVPVLFPECAELGNLADVLETARKEERPLAFDEKLALCTDVAHGLEILHACDIVHGDVKCENILVFENGDHTSDNPKLRCKLTDFGALQLDNGDYRIAGSKPWQAPEIELRREAAFKIENAKRTDVYGFGMLVWRTMLDGDPFKSIHQTESGDSSQIRQRRNEAIASMKKADTLVSHCVQTLAESENFTKSQLRLVSDVINATLHNDPRNRELDLSRIIRLLSYDMTYEERHPVKPSRMATDVHIDMIDIEKWYSEFESASPVVQIDIMASLEKYAQSSLGMIQSPTELEEKGAAAYQLAVCCANSFGGQFRPELCIKWLEFATQLGSPKARQALRSFEEAFPSPKTGHGPSFKNPFDSSEAAESELSSSWASFSVDEKPDSAVPADRRRPQTPPQRQQSWLAAAQNCDYAALTSMLDQKVKISTSTDGVSTLHFLSSWDLIRAKHFGERLIQAGADIDAIAERGSTIGGTPLMWSVYGDHSEHTRILLELGADPLVGLKSGEDALIVAARLHLSDHLQLLLEYVRPVHLRKILPRLLEAAAGGDSRFTRITRHGIKWQTAASSAFGVLQRFARIITSDAAFKDLIGSAVLGGAASGFGRVNVDVQLSLIKDTDIAPEMLNNLLRHSILTFNKELFDGLLGLGAPLDSTFERGRNLLHLCARIPDHSLAATAFAPRLIGMEIDIERKDESGLTPWMDAVLERKWDLADLLLHHGADPLQADVNGYNIIGLCITTVNLGALKFLLKYTGDANFKKQFFMVNQSKQITSLQLASSLTLPRAHGMKVEVMGTFLTILSNFAQDSTQVDFRSDGLMPNATALDIAASKGIVHAVRHLVKKGAKLPPPTTMLELSRTLTDDTLGYVDRKNLERCLYIMKNYKVDPEKTMQLAADWTNLKTIDESKISSSWENVCWDYSNRRKKGANVVTE